MPGLEARCARRPTRNAQVSSEFRPGALLRGSSTQRSPSSGQAMLRLARGYPEETGGDQALASCAA